MTMNNEATIRKMISLIKRGSYVEEVAETVGIAASTAYRLLKSHYPVKKAAYAQLLATSRRNKKLRAEAKLALSQPLSEEAISSNQEEVIVMDTGYLIKKGIDGIMQESLDIYVPAFCIKELEKLSHSYQVAEDILTFFWATNRITSINLRGNEDLYVDPNFSVKNRSIGVVALCCELDSKGFKVRLSTNSREIETLATLQECGISVSRI